MTTATITAIPVAGFDDHGVHHVIFYTGDSSFDVIAQTPEQRGTDAGQKAASFTCATTASFHLIEALAREALAV